MFDLDLRRRQRHAVDLTEKESVMLSNPRVPFQISSERPPLEPLNGKPIMVHLCMNIEYWPFDRPMPASYAPQTYP